MHNKKNLIESKIKSNVKIKCEKTSLFKILFFYYLMVESFEQGMAYQILHIGDSFQSHDIFGILNLSLLLKSLSKCVLSTSHPASICNQVKITFVANHLSKYS